MSLSILSLACSPSGSSFVCSAAALSRSGSCDSIPRPVSGQLVLWDTKTVKQQVQLQSHLVSPPNEKAFQLTTNLQQVHSQFVASICLFIYTSKRNLDKTIKNKKRLKTISTLRKLHITASPVWRYRKKVITLYEPQKVGMLCKTWIKTEYEWFANHFLPLFNSIQQKYKVFNVQTDKLLFFSFGNILYMHSEFHACNTFQKSWYRGKKRLRKL